MSENKSFVVAIVILAVATFHANAEATAAVEEDKPQYKEKRK